MSSSSSSDYLPVAEFFHDRSIFVTGVTGFIGKTLVEKLLRSCPGIKNIYVLMRPKKDQDVNVRLMELTDSPLFDQLRKMRPSDLKKIIPIMGDLEKPNLGISESDQSILIRTVSVVFHSAATVKFNEALNLSVNVNVLATTKLLELSHRMLRLEAFIHVSTAYCNCDKKEVKEIMYPTSYDPEKIIDCMEWMDEGLIKAISPIIIGNQPNTYTFTKALSEELLMKKSGNLPVAIVRPSIVVSTMKEPVAGWVDNYNGLSGLIAAAKKGVLRNVLVGKNIVADLVPVDLVVNLIIAAAWRTALSTKTNEIKIYNCCTGIQNPITWESFINQCVYYGYQHPLKDLVWYPTLSCCNDPIINKLTVFFYQLLPAYIIDAACCLVGKKPRLVKIQNTLDKAFKSFSYFSFREWKFYDDNVQHLNSILSNEDREIFYFDVKDIDWSNYLKNYVIGVRTFLFKENSESLQVSRKQLKKLHLIHRFVQLIGILLICFFMMTLALHS